MQEAAREGYNPIVLVGADLGFVPRREGEADENHFAPDYHTRLVEPERARIDTETHIDFHQQAKAWCDAHGIQILNATLGGELEVHPRIDFDSLF